MTTEFRFLRLRNTDGETVTMYIDSKRSKEWGGKSCYSVKANIPTKNVMPDGNYSFTDGRVLAVIDGKVDSLKTRGEVVLEDGMQEFRTEIKQLNENFAALAEAMVAITKAIKNG